MGLPKRIPKSRPVSKAEDVPDDQKRVIVNRYRVEKKLGSGNFGTAFLVKDLKTKNPADEFKVLKEIPCGDLQPDETVDAMHEAKLLSKLDNSGIVKFHDSFLDGEFFCIVTEYCEGGDLDEYVIRMSKRGQTIPEKQVMDWTAQLLLAVHYMHVRRVLHRDLKARNIFLKDNCIKIGDFGISRILMGTADMATTFTGTPYYMSPEVLKHEGYNSKSDVWSIGCIMYELCCHKHAFEGQGLMGVMYKIVEGDCPTLPDKYSRNVQNLLQQIFAKDPEARPGASELIKMPFVAPYVQRHIEKMKLGNISELNSEDVDLEAEAIELTLKKKHHRKELQLKTDEDKMKNMAPRERMRLRKQEEADKKARELRESTRINLQENIMRKQHIKATLKQSEPAPWQHEGMRKDNTFIVKEKPSILNTSNNSSNNSSGRPTEPPALIYREFKEESEEEFKEESKEESEDESEEENAEDMLVLNKTAPIPSSFLPTQRSSHILRASHTLDDRPITPMKNRMVYDVRHSTLDFKDGIPDDPKVAETYYSQFDDDFSADERQSKEFDQEEEEDSERDEDVSDDDVEEVYEQTLVAPKSDQEVMVKMMEDHLGITQLATDEGENTLKLADDTVAGAFGPTARSIKIRNLRSSCEQKLGKAAFKKAYDFLKRERFDKEGATSTVDENAIMAELAKITSSVRDCFLIDQLLFLEMQANNDKNS